MGRPLTAARRAAERRATSLGTLRDGRPVTVTQIGTTMTLDVDAEARGWYHSAVAYRCVAQIADNGASVDLGVHRPDGSRIEGHWCDRLFNKLPNPDMSARAYKSVMLQQIQLSGQHFAFLDRGDRLNPAPEPLGIYPLYEDVQVIMAARPEDSPRPSAIIGYVLQRHDGIRVPMLPDEVLWLRMPHPFRPHEALAPWKAARFAVDQDAYAREWQRSSFENGAQPGGIVYLGEMAPDQFAKAKASFRSSVEGAANARKHLLVASPPGSQGKGIEYVRLGLTPEEVDYLETRVANAEEVMLAFGVPRDLLMGGATYENRAASKTALWSDTIVPQLEVIASEVDRVLLPDDVEEARFDLSKVDALQEAQQAIIDRVTALVDDDLLMLDEARSAVGYDPLPGGQGQQTITAYRAQFAPQPAPAAPPAGSRMDDAAIETIVRRALADVLAPILGPPPARPQLERTDPPQQPAAEDVQAAYDALEADGRAAVRRLSREQSTLVLRDFDRLMKRPNRSAEWLSQVRDVVVELAREQTIRLAPPDPEQVTAAELTQLDVAHGPGGWEERIRARDLFDPGYWKRRTAETLRPFIERVWRRGGGSISGSFDLADPTVAAELAARIDDLAGKVTATTEQVIRAQLLAHGVAQGESIPELRARLQKVFTDLSDWRATMIARTETVGGYSAAALRAAVQAGAVTKTWLATDDTRTRPTHRSCNGRTTTIEGRFPLTQSRWPADPQAPASQSIQCRCALTFGFTPQKED